jgi:hypothetical protein
MDCTRSIKPSKLQVRILIVRSAPWHCDLCGIEDGIPTDPRHHLRIGREGLLEVVEGAGAVTKTEAMLSLAPVRCPSRSEQRGREEPRMLLSWDHLI